MLSWTKRLIALTLWVPFALYVCRELAVAAERSVSPLPALKLPDRDQAAKAKTVAKGRADAARVDVQSVGTFQSGAEGAFQGALAERAWAVDNARTFLDAAGNAPTFGGDKQGDFAALHAAERGGRNPN